MGTKVQNTPSKLARLGYPFKGRGPILSSHCLIFNILFADAKLSRRTPRNNEGGRPLLNEEKARSQIYHYEEKIQDRGKQMGEI